MGVLVDFGNGKKKGLSDTNPGGTDEADEAGDVDLDDPPVQKSRTGKPGFANGGVLKKAKRK